MLFNRKKWSQQQFAAAKLGDQRRTRRAVQIAERMLAAPNASIPNQMQGWKETKATYRLLDEEDVTHETLMTPHWDETRRQAREEAVVLIIQDTTEMDYTGREVEGLGPIGDGRGYGFLLHNALAVRPKPREILGLMYQAPVLRVPRPSRTESSYQRAKRQRESQVWEASVKAIGQAPEGVCWVHLGDRGSDIFAFFKTCLAYHCHFLVRAQTDRCVAVPGEETGRHMKTFARSLTAQGHQVVAVTDAHKKPREAELSVAFSPVMVQPPFHSRQQTPIEAWVVRAWETTVPPAGQDPVEWILVTSVAVATLDDACTRLAWYEQRPLVEDYHQCLKTGCQMEARQLKTRDRLFRLLGMLGVVAVYLLQLREWARLDPTQLAHTKLPVELVNLVAVLLDVSPDELTLDAFWRGVAQQGGYLGRRRDGPPGWKTIWKGWHYLQTLLKGVQLAARLPPQ